MRTLYSRQGDDFRIVVLGFVGLEGPHTIGLIVQGHGNDTETRLQAPSAEGEAHVPGALARLLEATRDWIDFVGLEGGV